MAHKLFARHDLEWIAEMAEELGVLVASSEKS
jgi:hypothetical protein